MISQRVSFFIVAGANPLLPRAAPPELRDFSLHSYPAVNNLDFCMIIVVKYLIARL